MKKCYCDICKTKEADIKLKVKIRRKQKMWTQGNAARTMYVGFSQWEKIDVCEKCYSNLERINKL